MVVHLHDSPVFILAFLRTPSRKSELFAIAATYTYRFGKINKAEIRDIVRTRRTCRLKSRLLIKISL